MRGLWGKRRETLIERLCRQSGGQWRIHRRDFDEYGVRNPANSRCELILIRHREGLDSVIFQSIFPMRFSLETPPAGLFARLLMRNFDCLYAYWTLTIGQSCEACPYLVARVPTASLDGRLFDQVCREIMNELLAFRQELYDKFRYDLGDRQWPAADTAVQKGSLANGADPGIRFLGPVQDRRGTNHLRLPRP